MSPQLAQRIEALSRSKLNSFHVDPFGLDPDSVKPYAPLAHWLYTKYFRCKVYGKANIPTGRALVIANHSGQLPFDGLMIAMAFMLEAKEPRLLRGMAERWSAELPFISSLFARTGTVVGDPNVCRDLLENDEAILAFPEGVRGISKLFKNRYRLEAFGTGFMKLALQTRSPIIPVAVIGAEEQAPSIANFSKLGNLLGAPGLPVIFPQILPIPLPVRYRIYIGKPLKFNPEDHKNDHLITAYTDQVQCKIQGMINHGLKVRKHIFW